MDFSQRFCIFCGNPPVKKNREHVLPLWLLRMTGDPKRVVNFGMNPKTTVVPRFDWASFTFPSCEICNAKYAELEGRCGGLMESLIARQPIAVSDYLIVLDWLDKVRIGLWLGYMYLHENPIEVTPTFHIDSRLGKKDRMLAIYTIDTNVKGLNAWGAETLCFQAQPSCFALNINSVCLLNMSWDFMCAARCGFPSPMRATINLHSGMMECADYVTTHRIKHPLLRKRLIKPSIHLYQPILQEPFSKSDFLDDDWLVTKLLPDSERLGQLYRQWDDKVELLDSPIALVENGEVQGHHVGLCWTTIQNNRADVSTAIRHIQFSRIFIV